LDKLDYLILSELLSDTTQSFVELAKKVHTAPYTARRRYEKMKKEGLIFKCTISLDLSKLGYQGKAFLLINLAQDANKSETINYLKTIKNVMVVTEIVGYCDILVIAPIIDLRSIQELVNAARKTPRLQNLKIACINDISFPVGSNFSNMLCKKSQDLAKHNMKKLNKS
jgi:Lrp/AsnC family leucine-responsive transcriptional regulator